MKRAAQPVDGWGLLARLALLGLIAWLLNLAPLPHVLTQSMLGYTRALTAGQPGVAAASLEQAAVFLPWRRDFLVAAARYRLQAGDLPGAAAYFDQPELQELFRAGDWLELGDAFLLAGNPARAEAAWRKALDLGGTGVELYDHLHQLYLQRGDFQAAADALRPTLLLRPDEPRRAYQLGLYLAALQPEAALVYLEQGSAVVGMLGDQARELQRVIRSAQLSDEPAYVHVQAGRQLAVMGEWLLAGEAFRQAVQIRPDYAEAWAFLGEARQQTAPVGSQSSRAQALADLERALALSPQSAAVNGLLALYSQRQGDVDQMVSYLSAAAAAEPENPVWQADLGRALALQGDLAAARQHYEQAVQLAPQNAFYWRLLGEFSLVYQVDLPDLGLPAMRQALALEPESPAALDLLGAAYLALENDALAERFLVQALQAEAAYAPAYLHLGVLNLYRGQASEAQRLLRKAEQVAGPGSEVAEQARQLLGDYFPR